jgi:hypothetical protein
MNPIYSVSNILEERFERYYHRAVDEAGFIPVTEKAAA